MIRGKFNILLDAFAGSSGKAKMFAYLADKFRPDILGSTNNPNAGHTVVMGDRKFVAKILPSAMFLNVFCSDYKPVACIGPTAAFTLQQLEKEMKECQLGPWQMMIHERAGVVTPEHKDRENQTLDGPKSIASTCQGSGTFLADKILRKPGLKLARDYPSISEMIFDKDYFPFALQRSLDDGLTMFHEVSQGVGLDINHGISYPYCTSRSCNSLQAISDMAPRLNQIGDIYLNVHVTPIRVGNIIEDDKEVGNSGPGYADQEEITWRQVGERAGMPEEEIQKLYNAQLTTVTKRLRRVYTFSWEGLKRAVAVSSATKLMLNFVQYHKWGNYKVRKWDDLDVETQSFIYKIQDFTGLPVVLIGTGPDHEDIIDREWPCR